MSREKDLEKKLEEATKQITELKEAARDKRLEEIAQGIVSPETIKNWMSEMIGTAIQQERSKITGEDVKNIILNELALTSKATTQADVEMERARNELVLKKTEFDRADRNTEMWTTTLKDIVPMAAQKFGEGFGGGMPSQGGMPIQQMPYEQQHPYEQPQPVEQKKVQQCPKEGCSRC